MPCKERDKVRRSIAILFFVIVCFCLARLNTGTVQAGSENVIDTVILCSTDDPYYSLAEEISAVENIPIFHTLEDVYEAKPVFLLWVAAPGKLTASLLLEFGRDLKNMDSSISVGIISGKDIEEAHSLWARAGQIPASDFAIINGTKENKIEPEIIHGDDTQINTLPLTRENLLNILADASVVQVSMEGAAGSWFDQSLDIVVKYSDIPELDSTIIQNYGCSTFRPWEEHSIALECIHQGAAAYSGFVFPSIAGTRFGDYANISLLYTWDQFPLGHLVQIQNQAAMQSYVGIPHFFMLGDPRIFLRSERPYTISSDEIVGGARVIQLSEVPDGLVPVYIPDGARFDFVKIPGLASSTMDSAYFNSRLQMIDINNDKYIIIDNEDDTVTIELMEETPLFWLVSNRAINFLDSIVVENQSSSLYLAIPFLLLLIIGIILKRYRGRDLVISFAFGAILALITLAYILLRLDKIVVTNVPVSINWLFLANILIFAGYGELFYTRAKNFKGKILAVWVANLHTLVTLIVFVAAMIVKWGIVGDTPGINKPGYPWLFSLKELFVGYAFYFIAYFVLARQIRKKSDLQPERGQQPGGGMSLEIEK